VDPVKLIKPPGSEFWLIEVITENGQARSISTGCRTKSDAEVLVKDAKIREIETAARNHRLTAEVVTLITAGRNVLVSEAILEWGEWMKVGTKSPRTRDNNLSGVSRWVTSMGLSAMPIGAITEEHIHRWINDPLLNHKLGTRILRLACIRNFFRFCNVKRYILSDPSRLVAVDHRAMSHEQRETRHKLVFEDDEIDFILSVCDGTEPNSITDGFFGAAITLGRDLAIRLGDVCNLEWSCFDFERGIVVIWTDKSNTRVAIPMSERVEKLVTSLPRNQTRFLFPNEQLINADGKRRAMLSVYFGRLFKSLGFEGYTFHSLRATMATTMAANGSTIEEIAKTLGHTGTSCTKAYIRKVGAAKLASAIP